MIVLDTHVWLWLATRPDRLSKDARHAIRSADKRGELVVAQVSLWEAALIHVRGRVGGPRDTAAFVHDLTTQTRARVEPLSAEIAGLAAHLAGVFPKDPGDRLIAATAIALGVPLVSADAAIAKSNVVRVVW